jgi:iron complex transport system ATP-binding protein
MHHEVAVRGHGVVLSYDTQVAVDESDFEIPTGRVTAVIGPNGSGKSTILAAIAGLLDPRRGKIEVLGRPPERAHRRVSIVLQSTKVNEVMPVTVGEIVAMGRYALRGPYRPMQRADREACRRAMQRLEVADLAGHHLTELSGGQRQRVFVAQGLAQEADLLLLDEPVTGLDLLSRQRINEAIEDELARGVTVVASTHDVAEANEADHVMLMAGRVHTEGPPVVALDPDRLSDAYGIGIVHLEDGSIVLDDAAHRAAVPRHVHFERRVDGSRTQ